MAESEYTGCRCGAGYTPPEAQQGYPLTPAADVYQFGGLCYFMAVGSPPPTPVDYTTGTLFTSPPPPPDHTRDTLFTSQPLDDITAIAQKAMGCSSSKPTNLFCCTSACLKALPAAA